MLFPSITPEHWRLELARARATPNEVSAQIKQLCRGESQAAKSTHDAARSGDLPASPARNTLPAGVGELAADAIGGAADGGHQFTRGGEAGLVASAKREPVSHAPDFTHGSGVVSRVSQNQIRRETDQH